MTTTSLTGQHRRPRPRGRAGAPVGAVSMLAAAATAGWLLASAYGEPDASSLHASQPAKAPPAQHIQHRGTVTAASADSFTTATVDGGLITFRLTPETNRLNTFLAPAQRVVVTGVLQDGVPVATAVADASGADGNGPPMDYGLPA